MRDAFGNSPADFAIFQDLQNLNLDPEEYLRSRAERHTNHSQNNTDSTYVPHRFWETDTTLTKDEVMRAEPNSQGVALASNTLEAMNSIVEEVLYLGTRFEKWIPIREKFDPGAETYKTPVWDSVGRGKRYVTGATDVPTAKVRRSDIVGSFYSGAIDVEYSFQEHRAAMFQNIPLEQMLVQAALEGALEHLEIVATLGDPDVHNSKGLINLPTGPGEAVLADTLASKLGAMTGLQMLQFLQNATTKLIVDSKEVITKPSFMGDLSWYFPTEVYDLVTNTPIGDNVDKTVWNFYMSNNSWKKRTGKDPMINSVVELAGAGANGSTDRGVLTVKSERVMCMNIPMMPTIVRYEILGRVIKYLLDYRYGELDIYRPTLINYYDNI